MATLNTEFTSFKDIKVSTQTVIASTNLTINTDVLFMSLPVSNYSVSEKRRGRKRKADVQVKPDILEDGCIITIKYGDKMRGVDVKQRKNATKYFRNALTVVMFIDGKLINGKIARNGKLQLTGCKNIHQPQRFVHFIWKYMNDKSQTDTIYQLSENTNLTVYYLTVMTNIDFKLGFPVNREKLDMYVNDSTEYNSLLETSFGYTGTNIRIRVVPDLQNDYVITQSCDKDQNWTTYQTTFADYLKTLTKEEQEKISNKVHYNTFLVFHSGSVIMSSTHMSYMEQYYNTFRQMLLSCRSIIEDKSIVQNETKSKSVETDTRPMETCN